MIILPREKNQGIAIGDTIFVDVVEIRDDKVCLGIECSDGEAVYRKEDAVKREVEKKRTA